MADRETLLALKERVEKASGPDRELDAMFYCVEHGRRYSRRYGNDFAMWVDGVPHEVKIIDLHLARFTASIDAALALCERMGQRLYTVDASVEGRFRVMLVGPKRWQYSEVTESNVLIPDYACERHRSLCLATLSALLSALSQQPAQDGDANADPA